MTDTDRLPSHALEPDWQPRPFRCQIKDEEGPAYWVTVNAIGRNDARGLARMAAYDQGAVRPAVIAIEEAT